jgi:hypothetical protein
MANFEQDKAGFQFNESIANKINTILKPMNESFSITNFSYLRFYSDGRLLHLQPDLHLLKILLENNFNNKGLENPNLRKAVQNLQHKSQYCWPPSSNDPLSQLLGQHGIGNSMSMLAQTKEYLDSWTFSTTTDNSEIRALYAKNKDIFSHFIAYFNEKINDTIHFEEKDIYFHSSLYEYYYGNEG